MAPSIQAALGSFVGSVTHVGHELINAFLALFGAFLAFGQAIASVFIQAGQAVFALGADLVQSVAGFIFANFFILAIIGGGYYVYTRRQGGGGSRKTTRRK
ncbi:hypothetical protein PENSPDRAFT_679153 [Peniophora sp. CONT]|nr:hypothetical protein PENSPDRAFT_679153 [Peniophora sp. CONT]